MNDEEAKSYRQIILTLCRWINGLRAGEQAMIRVILELETHVSPEVFAVLLKYVDYRDEGSQQMLLELEKKHPWLAAELDKGRPLIPPDELGDEPPHP